MVLAVGETAMRPAEIFALHWPEIRLDENLVHVKRSIDLDTGKLTWPKDDDGRLVVMSPAFREHIETMPRTGKIVNREMGQIVYPAPQGAYMRRSSWSSYWNAIRVAAGMPGQDFYELKHRAIQWMVDPIEDGGLGLDSATAAEMVGHDDGGYLIATVYTKLAKRRAIARAQRAMDAYQQRRDAANAEPPRLEVVREAG
jgi:integrase